MNAIASVSLPGVEGKRRRSDRKWSVASLIRRSWTIQVHRPKAVEHLPRVAHDEDPFFFPTFEIRQPPLKGLRILPLKIDCTTESFRDSGRKLLH